MPGRKKTKKEKKQSTMYLTRRHGGSDRQSKNLTDGESANLSNIMSHISIKLLPTTHAPTDILPEEKGWSPLFGPSLVKPTVLAGVLTAKHPQAQEISSSTVLTDVLIPQETLSNKETDKNTAIKPKKSKSSLGHVVIDLPSLGKKEEKNIFTKPDTNAPPTDVPPIDKRKQKLESQKKRRQKHRKLKKQHDQEAKKDKEKEKEAERQRQSYEAELKKEAKRKEKQEQLEIARLQASNNPVQDKKPPRQPTPQVPVKKQPVVAQHSTTSQHSSSSMQSTTTTASLGAVVSLTKLQTPLLSTKLPMGKENEHKEEKTTPKIPLNISAPDLCAQGQNVMKKLMESYETLNAGYEQLAGNFFECIVNKKAISEQEKLAFVAQKNAVKKLEDNDLPRYFPTKVI